VKSFSHRRRKGERVWLVRGELMAVGRVVHTTSFTTEGTESTERGAAAGTA